MRAAAVWRTVCLLGALGLAARAGAAEDRQALENSLFQAEAESNSAAAAIPEGMLAAPETKSIGFSGEITVAAVESVSNSLPANFLYTYTVSNIFLDARLPRMAKVFANLEATYLSQNQLTAVALRELFMDFNLGREVYFRAGKQVLQWGRCVLWNPTDLINVERPRFVRKIGYREGAYGLKVHVPSGAGLNVYGFVDTGSAPEGEEVASAVKTEFLLGNFELALSAWGKKGFCPVWGADFSTRLLGVDTVGEASVTRGENRARIQAVAGRLEPVARSEVWLPRASLDFSRSFTVGDFKDRLTLMVEGYYDRSGYADNVLDDPTVYDYAAPAPAGATRGTFKDFLRLTNLYDANYFSRGYVALFATFNRFLLADLNANVNCIQNLADNTGLISLGLTYSELNGFTLGGLANFSVGGPEGEYRFSGEKYNLQLTAGISF